MSSLLFRISLITAVAYLCSACGLGQFQTARTEPKGHVRFTVAQTFQTNENMKDQGNVPTHLPPQAEVRVGVHERVDVGVSTLLLSGLMVDGKVNLIPPDHDFALALRLGAGAAYDLGGEGPGWILHVPFTVIASYRFLGCLSPYAGLGYGAFWVFGREPSSELFVDDPEAEPVDRKGYGDGVLRLTAGLEWMINARLGILAEYTFLPAVVDDPGDNFTFVDNHLFGLGLRF